MVSPDEDHVLLHARLDFLSMPSLHGDDNDAYVCVTSKSATALLQL